MTHLYKKSGLLFLIIIAINYSTAGIASPQQDCVDKINELRATIGLYPLQRWTEQESCVERTIQIDAEAGEYHKSIRMGDNCGASGQNVCAGSAYSSVTDLINKCPLDQWQESEDDGPKMHYDNLATTTATHVACGFYQKSDGSIWSNMNFGTPQ